MGGLLTGILYVTDAEETVRIGYFHGGRTYLLYRAYIGGYFEKEGLDVQLITRNGSGNIVRVPKEYETIRLEHDFGKITGLELLELLKKGELDGATVGEGSFIKAVADGMPIVAVALLGHDTREAPAHAMVFRTDTNIVSLADIAGKKLASRRGGPTEAIVLREFLQSINMPPSEVTIQDQIDEDELRKALRKGSIDGAYMHLQSIEELIEMDHAPIYVYRTLDWVDPEISSGTLVFHNDFVRAHPERVERIVRAYMDRIAFEGALSQEERMRDPDKGFQDGLQMEKNYLKMNLPQYDLPPLVSLENLEKVRELLLEHGVISRRVALANFVDNSFVEALYKDPQQH